MSRLQLDLEQIVMARNYTLRLLDHVEPGDWFRQPPGGVTHIAWQVGHLAMAEYRLALERIRGRMLDDEQIIPASFLTLFARLSVPDPDPARYPSPSEIRTVLDRVHQRVLEEVKTLSDKELDQAPLKSHPIATTKHLSLVWCAHHEMLHAGQIGLIRRLLGQAAIW